MNIFQYENVVITGMDAERTHPDPESALFYVFLKLSKTPTAEWVRDFDIAWKNNFYMMKRRAEISGGYIQIRCSFENWETEQLPELEKVIMQVNARQIALEKQAHDKKLRDQDAERETRKKIEEAAKRFDNKN